MDNNALYNTIIEIEPKQNINFRYEISEMHGVLNGKYEKYPKIKLNLPQNNQLDNLFVLCSLHCFTNSKTLSPHLLIERGETAVNYRFIFEEMKILNNNPLVRVWELEDYRIIRLKNKFHKTSLENKKQEFKKLNLLGLDFAKLLGQLDLNNKKNVENSGKLNVCLGFTIFKKVSNEEAYTLYKDTVYSCIIYHGDDLRIHKLCNKKGSVLGGTDVNIFIKYESYLPLIVFIKKVDEITKETVWCEKVEINDTDKFNKSGISFTMPKYNGPTCEDDEIKVLMSVMVKDTNYISNIVPFFYVNERKGYDLSPESKRKRISERRRNIQIISTDYAGAVELPLSTKDIRRELDNLILNIEEIFSQDVSHKFMDSVLYDALRTKDAFIHIYKIADKLQKKNIISDFRNDNGENLLHWACKSNLYQRICPLIGMGCHINQQDHLGRTPLHIALTTRNKDSILEIQKLFKIYPKYSKEVEDDLVKMMKAYNDNGYTVLHETMMLADYNQLLEIMLEFMQKHDMNILDYHVLGNGDSIGHLAVKHNLLENIRPIIEKYIPNYKMAENYAGVMVKDLLMDEMFENLKI